MVILMVGEPEGCFLLYNKVRVSYLRSHFISESVPKRNCKGLKYNSVKQNIKKKKYSEKLTKLSIVLFLLETSFSMIALGCCC